jgi:tRNA1Val (adenine37-N6)-methyltransferase
MSARGPGGIIQVPRRPAGWVPPGPPPAGAQGRAELFPGDGEDLCLLSGDWRIFQQQRGHRWSLDDLVTAWVAANAMQTAARPAPRRALDLGCGLGSVLMMIAWRFPAASVVGLEAQPDRAAMARRSLAYNGADDRCRVFDGDLRDLSAAGAAPMPAELDGPFELITGTPPYFPRGAGTESLTPQVAPCRFELRGGVEEYLAAAAPRLAEGGRIVVCTAALERERVTAAALATPLRHLEHWDIVPRAGKPVLIMVDVFTRADASPSPSAVPAQHVLTVRDAEHRWTPELRAVRAAMGLPPTTPAGD